MLILGDGPELLNPALFTIAWQKTPRASFAKQIKSDHVANPMQVLVTSMALSALPFKDLYLSLLMLSVFING